MQNVLTSKENTKIQTNKQSKANKKLANKIYKRGKICQSAVLIAHDVLRSERSRITLWLPSQLINWLWKWIWYPRATAQTNEQGMWNSNERFHGEKSRAKILPVLLQEKEVLEVKGAELDNPALHLISWRSYNGLDIVSTAELWWKQVQTHEATVTGRCCAQLCPQIAVTHRWKPGEKNFHTSSFSLSLQPELPIVAPEDGGSFWPKYRKLMCSVLLLLPGLAVLLSLHCSCCMLRSREVDANLCLFSVAT